LTKQKQIFTKNHWGVQDLTGGNVMLTSCPTNPHGFCARVSDFGLSRSMDANMRIQTNTYGTVTHMPPELLTTGMVSKVRRPCRGAPAEWGGAASPGVGTCD
jgi:Protein tyrosine and serine/threonine kinase